MSGCILKETNCDSFCSFKSVSYYCFDCPALLCNKCRISMHTNAGNHKLISFSNNDLKWDDKKLITSIMDNPKIGDDTFTEVSRTIKKIPDYEKPGGEESYNGPTWSCVNCTYSLNPLSEKRCAICIMYKPTEDGIREYDLKLDYFRQLMLRQFTELNNKYTACPDIPFENILYSYTREKPKEELSTWHRRYYPQRKYLNIINDIIEEVGFSIKLNELDRQYNEILTRKNSAISCNFTNNKILDELKKTTEIGSYVEINHKNNITLTDFVKSIKDSDLWTVINKCGGYSAREKRLIIVEMDLQIKEPLDLLPVFLKNTELGSYIKESFSEGTINMLHLKQAITDQETIDGAINFLRKTCHLCCMEYPMPEMIGLITCQHEFCKSCVLSWLEATIEAKYPCKWNCPDCSDDTYLKIDKNLHYGQLRGILKGNEKLISIFESKLLQEQLMKSPNFHWCSNEECTNGFEAEGIEKILCPSCKTPMCVKCNRKWQEAHENKTCQEFELWMLKNDPNLSKLLKDIGIECPGCGMRYALAAGGCLHFDCKACGIKFCGGCDQLFVDKCDKPNCKMTNFHSHHPRNCLYFLRDNTVVELETMLKASDYPKLAGKPEKMCQSMITSDTLKDVLCNKEVYATTALCEPHYKEYLVQFINRYKIDPADFVDSNSLNLMLFQMVIQQLVKSKNENDAQFKERLKKTVKESCLFYIPKGLIEVQPVN